MSDISTSADPGRSPFGLVERRVPRPNRRNVLRMYQRYRDFGGTPVRQFERELRHLRDQGANGSASVEGD